MIFFAEGDECRQVDDITVHAENCVADNQSSAARGSKNFRFQVLRIIMLIDNDACFRKTCAVDDAGVIIFIAENNAFAVAEGRDNADVGHVACVEDQCCFRTLELRQLAFERFMQSGVAGSQTAAAAACAPLKRSFGSGLLNAGICCQIKIAVGGQHQNLASLHFNVFALLTVHGAQGAVKILLLELFQLVSKNLLRIRISGLFNRQSAYKHTLFFQVIDSILGLSLGAVKDKYTATVRIAHFLHRHEAYITML